MLAPYVHLLSMQREKDEMTRFMTRGRAWPDGPPEEGGAQVTKLLLSVQEAAGLLGIGRDSAYALIREGRLPAVRIGRRILVPRAALEPWVLEQAAQDGPLGGSDAA